MMSDKASSTDLPSERPRNIKKFLQMIVDKVSFSSFIIHHSSLSLTIPSMKQWSGRVMEYWDNVKLQYSSTPILHLSLVKAL